MLLTWALLGFLALAAVITVRWIPRRFDGLGRARPFPRISMALCLAIAVGCAIPMWTHARLESRLSAAASAVAGGPVTVHCQTFGEAFVDVGAELGWVRWGSDGAPERSTLIKREPCRDLSAWLASSKTAPTLDQVIAVHVLTHETMHMVGLKNESQAECAAIQRDAEMAVALGATPAQGQGLARQYWIEAYPRVGPGYGEGCGAGGAYDEGLAAPPWADAD
ncbi:hypothetical protein [Cellulomonas rhizosphaerae]|uniref:Uncharacterized protein n=1 Tax=Cellulomonas rhizosphaerae TaxID=2293719 RepID=A0A413RIL2_9CELL|nr:hypothetical protein [Cellulomonas rhizosphaerae]RHA38180.1 hypothetical protein D1825_14870 [Cellulomonas rhizosphaerae]